MFFLPSEGSGVCLNGFADPRTWNNEFFILCISCSIDYIAFYNYDVPVGVLVAQINLLKAYNRPIWVTELVIWEATTEATKMNYLQADVSAFENDPDIYHYS